MAYPVQGLLCILSLLLVTLPLNVVQLVAWLLLPRRYGRIVSTHCHQLAAYTVNFFVEYLGSVDIVFSGDQLLEGESALVISNHLGPEVVHMFQLALQLKMLRHLRFVQKAPLKWIPINWTSWLHESPFIPRGAGPKAREASAALLRRLLCTLAEDRLPVWLVLFPEGTWVAGPQELHILERSQTFAAKSGLPVLKNVLTPRTVAFCAAVEGAITASDASSGQAITALYDMTFAYSSPPHSVVLGEAMPPSVIDYIDGGRKAGVPRRLHVHVKRVPFDGAPSQPLRSDAAAYVQRSFQEKEQLLDHFKTHQKFPGSRGVSKQMPYTELLVGCGVSLMFVLASLWVLWLAWPQVLVTYLATVFGLCTVVAMQVTWDENEVPAVLAADPPPPRSASAKHQRQK